MKRAYHEAFMRESPSINEYIPLNMNSSNFTWFKDESVKSLLSRESIMPKFHSAIEQPRATVNYGDAAA